MVKVMVGIISLLICAAALATASNESPQDARLETVKVIIVGGGASGVAAASRLVKAGFTDFLVVEAGDELGGRVAEAKMGMGRVELGAQYIHGEDGNVVHKLAKEWGMLGGKSFGEEALYDDGKIFDENLAEKYWEICEDIDERLTPGQQSKYGSVGEFFEAEFNETLENSPKMDALEKQQAWDYLQYFGRNQASESASGSWFQLGIEDTYEQSGDDGIFKNKYTYKDFLLKLGSGIKGNVRLKEKVTTITEIDNGVVVKTDKKNYTCQYVMLTVSLGVLKHGDITFIPPLPSSKMEAIHNVGFGTIGKIFLEYPQPWAQIDPKQIPDFSYSFIRRNERIWRDDPVGPWQDGVHDMVCDAKNPTVVTLWTIGHSARKAGLLPEHQLLQEADALVRKFLLPSIPNLPSPVSALSPSWSTNPLIRGTYSFNSPSTPLGSRKVLAEPVRRILFAGEATNTKHYATVHGAIETGWREADKIISIFNGGETLLVSFYALLAIHLFV